MRVPAAVRTLARDLDAIFGARLRALVVHGRAEDGTAAVQPLALVDGLTPDDLRALKDAEEGRG